MADFNFYINRQGIQGRKGEKGDTGFSPTISVGTDTLDEYKLIIANESNSFETPNLRGNINIQDNGGTYLRYDTETKQISAQSMDAATADTLGGVRLSTEADIAEMGAESVVTPSDVADALPLYLEGEGAVTITQDEDTSKTKINVDLSSVDELKSRVSAAEAEIVGIQADISDIDSDVSTLNSVTANHTTSISAINNNLADLNNNKVAKTDFATTESAGIVKVDGTTITVDENGVIASVGGGGTGDVTSNGNNTFTGNNEFKKDVTITCADSLSNPSGLTITNAKNPEGYKTTLNVNSGNGNFHVETDNAIELMSPFATYIDGGQSSLSVHNNGITFTSNDVLKYYNNDGSYNYVPLVTQENIKAGENIALNKNAETGDITISSTASGGGASIDDENISTTTVYSSDKTVNLATSLVDNAMTTLNQSKQDTLVSGTNIKTINGTSILGAGDITISSGGGDVPIATTEVAGKVKPDGTTITITNDGTISAVGGGDITAAGDNTFTGSNTFNSYVTFNNGFSTTSTAYLRGTNYVDNGSHYFSYVSNALNMNMPIKCNNSYVLTQNALVAGDGITLANTSQGVQISASGGSTPTNMVTTDTDQSISGAKTFTQPLKFQNTLSMSTGNTNTFYVHASGSYAQGYTTNIDFQKNLNIEGSLSGGTLTLAPNGGGMNALKYKDSSHTSNPSYDILHTGNLVTGDGITISEPNSTGVRTISGPSNEYIASMAMPSNRYVDLTLGASGTTYTAPADGWVAFYQKLQKGSTTQLPSFNIGIPNGVRAGFGCNRIGTSLGAATIRGFIPVRKDDIFYASYSLLDDSFTDANLRFYYAEGVPSA